MRKTIFAVSDIHGEYKALLEALEKAGFDENNPNHLLISIGDAFDRGDSSLSVYQYLKRLSDCLKGQPYWLFYRLFRWKYYKSIQLYEQWHK